MEDISIYCDGSAMPNPGPCGYGIIVIKDGQIIQEIYEYLGEGSNQIAQMMALKWSLKIANNHLATIYTDSQWSINLCTGKWKPHVYKTQWANIISLKKPNHTIQWVKGHNKDFYNQKVDKLAKMAVETKGKKWNCTQNFIKEQKSEGIQQWNRGANIQLVKGLKAQKDKKNGKNDKKNQEKEQKSKIYFKNKTISKQQKSPKSKSSKNSIKNEDNEQKQI